MVQCFITEAPCCTFHTVEVLSAVPTQTDIYLPYEDRWILIVPMTSPGADCVVVQGVLWRQVKQPNSAEVLEAVSCAHDCACSVFVWGFSVRLLAHYAVVLF